MRKIAFPIPIGRFCVILSLAIFANCEPNNDPLKFTSTECKITEPIYNHTFDLNSLHSDLAHIIKSDHKNDVFEFNVCGNLTKSCNGNSEVAACLQRDGKEFILGTRHELSYRSGRMFFNFLNGQQCRAGKSYELHVLVECDYTLDPKELEVLSYADDECSFYIKWQTPKACLPEPDYVKSNSCKVVDTSTGETFNMLPLSDSNYRAIDRNGSAFIINVCKPVLYGPNEMCPPGSSVCFVDLKEKDYRKKFFDYGQVTASPTIENNILTMRHKSNIVCNATHNYTSTIQFFCDYLIEYGQPDFMGLKGCNYQFSWYNSFACAKSKPCVVKDSITGFRYDMSSLANKKFNLTLDEKLYSFAICSDPGAPCLEHAGSCVTVNGQSTTLGHTNSNLRFNQTGSPYLLYKNGATCRPANHHNQGQEEATLAWSTKIEFVCATKGSAIQSGPKIIENSNCQLLIHYLTEAACQKQISCKTKGYARRVDDDDDDGAESEIDLSPLIRTADNYEAAVNDSLAEAYKSVKYFINVCRPLVPKYGLGCPGGSAACLAKMGKDTPEDEMSMGYPDVSLTAIDKTRVELKYLRGSTCPSDKSTQLSSSIQFYCDMRAGKGRPVLQSIIDQCHYQFEWPTSVICASHLCKLNVDTCEIINEDLHRTYSVRNASFTKSGRITIKGGGALPDIPIDLCGPDRKAVTDYAQNSVKLFFIADGPCGFDGKINVAVRIVCSQTEENFSSTDEDLCSITYTQHTRDICSYLGLHADDFATPSTTTTTPSATTTTASTKRPPTNPIHPRHSSPSWLTIILSVVLTMSFVIGSLLFALRTPERRARFGRCFRRQSPVVQYSRVEDTEEANLLLEQSGHFTDSDDDMLL